MKLPVLAFLIFMWASQVFCAVLQNDSELIEHARMERFISSQTLIVKIKSDSNFLEHLGEFKTFFSTRSGEWGYLTLNMIPDGENAEAILGDLSKMPDIIHAYFAPLPKNTDFLADLKNPFNEAILVLTEDSKKETPPFASKQTYLLDAPRGIGAKSAWNIPGGSGKNVKIIDVETCFNQKHENFDQAFYIGENPICEKSNHGTAVWGILAAKDNNKGVVGIAHDASFGFHGFIEGTYEESSVTYEHGINYAIQGAIENLHEGDILLIEQQMVGPDYKRLTVVEYWPHIYEQLKEATQRGIHCIEAAGNHRSNLDSTSYDRAFDVTKRDSGCVIVGAVKNDDKREKWHYSNFGSRIDAAGYGENVVTTGYGDLFDGGADRKYTAVFAGTSSAAPMVAGAIALVSSIAKEQGILLSPKEMRKALRETGSPQGPRTAIERVGNLPDVIALVKWFKLLQNE